MTTEEQIQKAQTPSRLDQFSLDFEYNKTLREVKRDVRVRTHKS